MNIDLVESLEMLRQAGVNVARSKVVDSAEDTVAFAERRLARDRRVMPIVLRYAPTDLREGAHGAEEQLRLEPQMRSSFERLRRAQPHRVIVAQAVTPAGTDIFVSGDRDDDYRVITIHGGSGLAHRMVPLGEVGAAVLAMHVQGPDHRGSSEKNRRLLEGLLSRLSDLFEKPGMDAFRMLVRLHENSYTVVDASIAMHGSLHLTNRLEPHSHDRKGASYRPSGRQ